MCEYSLNAFSNREAREGEQLILKEFPTGTKGFISPFEKSNAPVVCLKPKTKVQFQEIPRNLQGWLGVGPESEATFAKLHFEHIDYHDGFIFPGGEEILIQDLDLGIFVRVLSIPTSKEIPEEVETESAVLVGA